jgi:hypothetical protein
MKTVIFFVAIVLTVSFGIPRQVHSQNEGWVHFFTNPEGDDFYYDPQNIEYRPMSSWDKDQVVTVTIKAINRRQDANAREFTQRLQINCDKLMYRRLEAHITRNDGSMSSETQPGALLSIPPDSPVNSLPPLVCKKLQKHERDLD